MIASEKLVQVLNTLKEEEVMQAGSILPGMAPEEKVLWKLVEKRSEGADTVFMFHLYWFDTMIAVVSVMIKPDGTVVGYGGQSNV